MQKDPAIIRAERLRAVLAMPEYSSTIGAWIEEAYQEALHNMTSSKEPYEFHSAQGAYKAVTLIREQFERVFALEKAAREKQTKKTKENKNE